MKFGLIEIIYNTKEEKETIKWLNKLFRYALTGSFVGPPIDSIIKILGTDECLSRIDLFEKRCYESGIFIRDRC